MMQFRKILIGWKMPSGCECLDKEKFTKDKTEDKTEFLIIYKNKHLTKSYKHYKLKTMAYFICDV